jgi:hypothetical protein
MMTLKHDMPLSTFISNPGPVSVLLCAAASATTLHIFLQISTAGWNTIMVCA